MKKIYLYLILCTSLFASFDVAPQIQELSLDRQSTQKIYLKNSGDKLTKIKIYSERPSDQKSKELYMGDWIVVYPKIVYLKPKSKKIIRMAARPPKNLKDGEYRAHLVFEEIPVKSYDNSEKKDGGVGVGVEIMYKIISTVYGNKGELKYSGEFSDFLIVTDEKNVGLSSKVVNTGTAALDGLYKITYYKGDKKLGVEEIRPGKAMRENEIVTLVELLSFPKNTDKMKIEFYYRLEKKNNQDSDDLYETVKLGEKIVSVKKITREEYQKIQDKKIKVKK